MKNWRLNLIVVLAIAVAGTACGRRAQKKRIQEAARELETVSQKIAAGQPPSAKDMEAAAAAMQQMTAAGQQNVQLVDFRELKALLPESLQGLKRSDISGEKTSAFGVSISKAEATYENDEGASISVELTDMGGMPGVAAMAHWSWMATEVDRETDSGYERTTKISGHKAYEEYDRNNRSGRIQVMVKSRFLVEVQGEEVSADTLRAAVAAIPLDKLARL